MRKATLERIAKAVKEIEASGHRPTYKAIRTVLKRGSYATIGEALKAMRSSKKGLKATAQEIGELLLHKRQWANLEAEKHEAIDLATRLSVELEAAQRRGADAEAIAMEILDHLLETIKLIGRLVAAGSHAAGAHGHAEDCNARLAEIHKHNLYLVEALKNSYRHLSRGQRAHEHVQNRPSHSELL